jgi:hypothetical protein
MNDSGEGKKGCVLGEADGVAVCGAIGQSLVAMTCSKATKVEMDSVPFNCLPNSLVCL